MRTSFILRSYQRGGWAPGSRHQKHMTMNPTIYRYRFAGPRGPGPFTMKYWWTLGCFPTGLEVPFRLPEFLATYQRQHVPIEVEEWLQCFVKDPAEVLTECASKLVEGMERMPTREEGCVYATSAPSVASLARPIHTLEEHLGVHVSMVGLRNAAASPELRLRMLDDLTDYTEALRAHGSTPHRRLGQQQMLHRTEEEEESSQRLLSSTRVPRSDYGNNRHDNNTSVPGNQGSGGSQTVHMSCTDRARSECHAVGCRSDEAASRADPAEPTGSPSDATSAPLPPNGTPSLSSVDASRDMVSAAALRTPTETMPDERALLNFMTTVAEGCAATQSYDGAYRTLASSLFLAQDDASLSLTHANISSAALHNGLFKEAEYHGREAALLETEEMRPRERARASTRDGRGYRLWATALAYQDDFDGAEQVLSDALTLFPASINGAMLELLRAVQELRARHRHLPDELRGHRVQMASQQARGVVHGAGMLFDNEFDWTVFKGRLYPSKMNPTTNEMGSVFRRVGDLGGARSTSRSTECI